MIMIDHELKWKIEILQKDLIRINGTIKLKKILGILLLPLYIVNTSFSLKGLRCYFENVEGFLFGMLVLFFCFLYLYIYVILRRLHREKY